MGSMKTCLNCNHASFGDDEYGCCGYDVEVPSSWYVSIDFISKEDPYINCPVWELNKE